MFLFVFIGFIVFLLVLFFGFGFLFLIFIIGFIFYIDHAKFVLTPSLSISAEEPFGCTLSSIICPSLSICPIHHPLSFLRNNWCWSSFALSSDINNCLHSSDLIYGRILLLDFLLQSDLFSLDWTSWTYSRNRYHHHPHDPWNELFIHAQSSIHSRPS